MFTKALNLETPLARDFALVLLSTFLICLASQVAIPLWFTPVPIVTQNSLILLLAALLGPRRGPAAVFLFLAQGALGLPVFSNGTGGFLCFLGPRGGYLIGYLLASFVVGYLAEKRQTLGGAALALLAGNGVIWALGATYLSTFIGWHKAFFLGIAPFIIGDLLKLMLSLKVLQWAGWIRK